MNCSFFFNLFNPFDSPFGKIDIDLKLILILFAITMKENNVVKNLWEHLS